MMKNLQKNQILFIFLLLTSCATDKVEKDEIEVANPQNVWIYNGDNTVLKNVIEELKKSEYATSLERRLSKNEVLWHEAKFLLIENKKRILIPFLSVDKENVIGVLALVKDDKGKTTFDMTSRTQLKSKTNKLPFWNKGNWRGYFMALDANILGIKNGSPGFDLRKANNEKLSNMFGESTAKTLKTCAQQFAGFYVAFSATEEACDEDNESTFCYFVTAVVYVPQYEEVCWEDGEPAPQPPVPAIPDPIIPVNQELKVIHYRNVNYTPNSFLAYVNSETYSFSSPVISNNGELCTSAVRIVNPVFTLDLKIEQLINRNPIIPYYYLYGVTPIFTDHAPNWDPESTVRNADHWMDGENNYFENSTSIVEYDGRHRYIVGGPLLYSIPVRYKIEINSHTGEILSILRIDL
jgi:hypothetical protein